jgi:hypothetical protein
MVYSAKLFLQTVGAVTSLDDEKLGINLQGLSTFLPNRGKKQQMSPSKNKPFSQQAHLKILLVNQSLM